MRNIIKFLLVFLASTITLFSNPLQQSYLEENLPETFEEFQTILERDLQIYFSESLNNKVQVEYEFLRRGPTQSGLSYPKFYLWVDIYENHNLINSGTVRIESIGKIKVDVTHFVSKKEILENSISLKSIFPLSLCDVIRKKANDSK